MVFTGTDLKNHPSKPEWPVYNVAMIIYKIMLYFELIIGIIVDYTVTIRMIWMSVRSGRSGGSGGAAMMAAAAKSKIIRRKVLIHRKREMVAIKMVSLFIILWLLDSATGIVMVLLSLLRITSAWEFDHMLAMTTSWLSFRILAVFKLMDMFLRELKSAKHVNLPSSTNKKDSIAEASSQPDMVENSLKSFTSGGVSSREESAYSVNRINGSTQSYSSYCSSGTDMSYNSFFKAESFTTSRSAGVGSGQHEVNVSRVVAPINVTHKPREILLLK